jgi:predicted nucleic acid-binding protein
MAVTVIDASAIGAILFNEPEGPSVARRLGGATLLAPSLLVYEVANICVSKMRRHRGQRQLLLAAFALLENFEIEIVDVDGLEVVAVADETGLTAYDAAYLWLVRRLRGALVTLDRELAAAFEREA